MEIFISMKKFLLITLILTLVGCKVLRPKKSTEEVYESISEVKSTYDPGPEPVEESYEIVVEPDRILVYDEVTYTPPELEFVDRVENTKIQVVEVENRIVNKETMNLGRVVYKIPSEMKVRTTHQVIVRISKSTVHILENLEGEVKSTIIPVTETMEVKLVDPSPEDDKMFEIVPDNEGIQLVEDNESITEWTWNVTPKRSGEAKLKVVISIIRDGVKKEKVYSDEVIVKSDIKKSSWYFIRTYWEWIMSSLVLPFVIWFFTKRKKKEEED
jgi:hypothetical protein